MRRTVRRWIVSTGAAALAALAAGAAGSAVAPGAATTATVAAAPGDCQPLQCGGNHNQVLV